MDTHNESSPAAFALTHLLTVFLNIYIVGRLSINLHLEHKSVSHAMH